MPPDTLESDTLESITVEYDIFFSYRTTHRDWVETLAHNLKDQGYRIFLDAWELYGGQNFTRKIFSALKHARCAILVATPDAVDSGWVQDEYEYMFNLRQNRDEFFFIPVVMGEFPDFPFLENIHAIDFGDSTPENYRRAFKQLLCALDQKPPGPDPYFEGELRIPRQEFEANRELVNPEQSFLETIFQGLDTGGVPVLILAQADTDTQIYGSALRWRAETLYGKENTIHVFPPNSARADSAAYFGRLARQCGFDEGIQTSWDWADTVAEKLEIANELFLLVTGFENGPEESRAELAGELRQLNERYPFKLRMVLFGGERLARMKYAHGEMSLLNISEELRIPEMKHQDLKEIFSHRYPKLELSDQRLEEILEFTGHHPRLVHCCLQKKVQSVKDCERVLTESPLPIQLFTRFRGDKDHIPLCNLLQHPILGDFHPWPLDDLLRRLYWNNLTTVEKGKFVWRCEFIRKTGLAVLGC